MIQDARTIDCTPPNKAFGMTIEQLRQEIKKMRKNKSYAVIGKYFDLTKPTVRRIERGGDISQKITEKLGLLPSQKLQYTRLRRSVLNKIGQYFGYTNWSDYETKTLEDFEKHFDFETKQWKEN